MEEAIIKLHLGALKLNLKALKNNIRDLERSVKEEDWFKVWSHAIAIQVGGEFVKKSGVELFEGVQKARAAKREENKT